MNAVQLTFPLASWDAIQASTFDGNSKEGGFEVERDALKLALPPDAGGGWPNFGEDDFNGSDTD